MRYHQRSLFREGDPEPGGNRGTVMSARGPLLRGGARAPSAVGGGTIHGLSPHKVWAWAR